MLPIPLALLWLVQLAVGVSREGWRLRLAKLTPAEVISVLWILAFMTSLFIVTTGPDRRYYVYIVPTTILAAHAVWRAHEPLGLSGWPHSISDCARLFFPAVTVAFIAALVLRVPVAKWIEAIMFNPSAGSEPASYSFILALALLVIVLTAMPLGLLSLMIIGRFGLRTKPALLLLVVLGIAAEVKLYSDAIAHRSYLIRDASRSIAQVLESSLVQPCRVFGGVSDTFLIETYHRTLVVIDRTALGYGVYGEKELPVFKPTHALIHGKIPRDQINSVIERWTLGWAEPLPQTIREFSLCARFPGDPLASLILVDLRPKASR